MKNTTNIPVLLSIVLAVIANVAYSQNDNKATTKTHVVAGIVTSAENGDPLPGVNVVLQGSNKGVATDADGKFSFPNQLNEGQTLTFTFISRETQFYKVGAGNNDNITISMNYDPNIVIMEAAACDLIYVPKKGLVGKVKGWFR